MSPAERLALAAAGAFLLAGLAAGVWKYAATMSSPTHRAPLYVDVAHRAALLYSFACLVMMKLVEHSPYSERVKLWATGVPIFFFAAAVGSYVYHGIKRDTDNQFRERNVLTTWGMYLLIAGEIGGVVVLLWGFLEAEIL